ncbi:P-loop containing nucleoside triphosphate hydrolase protein [Xylariomycetidae sp. FL0641]|nr:P-loop containing nucleoside triphosphate hydrolase protein [Xylariomycetidae sp. FL0641]
MGHDEESNEKPTPASSSYDPGSRCEFRTYHTVPKDGTLKVRRITEPFEHGSRTVSDSSFALVIKREFTIEDQSAPKTVTLKVNSPHLLKAFRDVVGSYPSVASDFKSPFELSSPFQMLVHYWDELDHYRQEIRDAVARMHMNLLFQFMDSEVGAEREKLLGMLEKGQITYFAAWVIFRPGDILYTQVMGHGWLLRCHKTIYEQNEKIGPYLEVHCTYTDHNGKDAGMAAHKIVLLQKRHFGGENPTSIPGLPIFPRRYIHDDGLEAEFERRGMTFLELRGSSVQSYEGLAQYLREPPFSYWHYDMDGFDPVWLPFYETGRVVVDKATFKEDHNTYTPGITKAEPEPVLTPPFVFGYSLTKKTWCRFLIMNLSPVRWKQNAWENLILEEEQKSVLQALVTSHPYPANPRDQPEQKGKGLVILLHGAPGSGKTLSAESSAELTHKALISSSMASLETERSAYVFEYNLRRLLQYATMWKAIVLLDEADVFLEAREEKTGNAQRNALVAVFLKELEYFSGIIFLTTNRVDTFDWAMKSRIHLAMDFRAPGTTVRRHMWTQAIDSIPAEEIGIQDMASAVEMLADSSLNGREISNTLNTARTIAAFEGKKLQLEHLQKVLKVRLSFDRRLRQEKKKVASSFSDDAGHQLVRRGTILSMEPEEAGSD